MSSLRVLVASPAESLLSLYRAGLAQEGFLVVTASDALECVATLRDFEPDVLVLDHDLPWGRTEGVLATIDEDATMPNPLVIVLADSRDSKMERLLASNDRGAVHLKPIDPGNLAQRIREIAAQRASKIA